MLYNLIFTLIFVFTFKHQFILCVHLENRSYDKLTSQFGHPIGSKTTILTAGPRGPPLLQDVQFLEEISHFNRERIPERVVHAPGSGAFGTFIVTSDEIKNYTKAKLFQSIGKETPVAVRFSLTVPESGAADLSFGDRGFGVKFYTEEGNWDLVGANVPVFFIRDPQMFSSLVHANKRDPRSGLKNGNNSWDFFSSRPESLNTITHLFSEGIPDGWRHMPGFGVHALKLVNDNNKYFFAKFYWTPDQGCKSLKNSEVISIRGKDPDYARRDLFEAIERRAYPSWTLKIQVITPEEADKFEFNPFDATKIWPEKNYPLIKVGKLTLNKNPDNYFAEVEQLALSPANMVAGIEASPDKLLVGRLFAYSDAQRYRLGANHHLIPVNQPRNQVFTPTQRDGHMRTDANFGSFPNYYPNSKTNITDDEHYIESNYNISGKVWRNDDSLIDNYKQVKEVYNDLSEDLKRNLHTNLAHALKSVAYEIRERALNEFNKVDPNYAQSIRNILKEI